MAIHFKRRCSIVELTPALRAFAHTFHQAPNDADDLVQETLVKALNAFERFEPIRIDLVLPGSKTSSAATTDRWS
ncbi:hypothetical protein FJ977_18960 [Mesorhizobium sp. B2-1-3A]|nr:hypothetical protein FJ977_18960 [Mesorhizobium sp. B2-1-3A]